MAKKRIEGVSGVLGGLITPEPTASVTEADNDTRAGRHGQAYQHQTTSPKVQRIHARRGRPPNQEAGPPPKREKVTLRIGANLIARYRERSWDERRQLCELVEDALRAYQHNSPPQSAAGAD